MESKGARNTRNIAGDRLESSRHQLTGSTSTRCATGASSQEVIRGAQRDVRDFTLTGSRVKLKEVVFHVFVDLHNGGLVSASVAVVGGGEHRDDVALMGPVVSVHHELMGSCDSSQVVGVVELLRDVLAEGVASTTGRDTPTASVIGVGPQQIADWSFVRHFLHAVELSDLIEGVDGRRQTTMEAENLVLNDGGQGQVVEELGELLPYVGVSVLTEALIIESIPIKQQSMS